MGSLGKARIGHKAPNFRCDAVLKGLIAEVSLSDYISEKDPQWLILLFIPAAFSFVCPTEVLAFQNCLDEFRDRRCNVIFISVDTKHSLWHWQNVPRRYGGLGNIDVALLSDSSRKMSRDYGVLIEEEGICLRGMFILDEKAIVQQITLNNITVGRSVLEALRLLEAFQAVDKHGVLCPIDWKPASNADANNKTIYSNTLTYNYDERLATLQKEFGDVEVTDLDAKFSRSSSGHIPTIHTHDEDHAKDEGKDKVTNHRPPARPFSNDARQELETKLGKQSNSAPASASITPLPTPTITGSPTSRKTSNGHSSGPHLPHKQLKGLLNQLNTYETRRGSHVILEFADPACSPGSAHSAPSSRTSPTLTHNPVLNHYSSSRAVVEKAVTPRRSATPAPSPSIASPRSARVTPGYVGTGPTRLQMTFEAIKKLSAGLASPRLEYAPRGSGGLRSGGNGSSDRSAGSGNGRGGLGYFDVVPEVVET